MLLLIIGLCSNILSVYVSMRTIMKADPTFETYTTMTMNLVWTYAVMLPIFLAVFNAVAINNLVSEVFISFAFINSKKNLIIFCREMILSVPSAKLFLIVRILWFMERYLHLLRTKENDKKVMKFYFAASGIFNSTSPTFSDPFCRLFRFRLEINICCK